MASKIDIKNTLGGILQILFTTIFIIVIGTLFSLLTGYKSNDYPIILRIAVWSIDILISWSISTGFLKIFFRRKVSFTSVKYMFTAFIVSALVVWVIGFEDGDFSYVTSSIVLTTLVGAFWGIKIIKRKIGRPGKNG